jgi:hypothetical protein
MVRLDHHDEVGAGDDDPVAGREAPALRAGPEGSLGQQDPGPAHCLPKSGLVTGIDDIEPAAHDAHGR